MTKPVHYDSRGPGASKIKLERHLDANAELAEKLLSGKKNRKLETGRAYGTPTPPEDRTRH